MHVRELDRDAQPSITTLGNYTLKATQSDAAGDTGSASQAATDR